MQTLKKKYWQSLVELIRFFSGCSCVGIRILNSNKSIPFVESVGFTREYLDLANEITLNDVHFISTRVFTQTWLNYDLEYVSENSSFCCNDTLELDKKLRKGSTDYLSCVFTQQGYRTIGIIPLKYQSQVLGVIHIADKSPNKLAHNTVSFLETTAVYVGEAVNHFNVNKHLSKAEQDILFKNIVNHLTIESMPGLVMLANKQCEVLQVSSRGQENGFNINSSCYLAFGNDKPCEWCKLNESFGSRKPQYAEIERDGSFYEFNWIPINSELCLSLVVDITERKLMEKEITRLDRLTLVGEISASIAHEIRNPLTSVRGFLQLLSSKDNNDENKHYYSIMIDELDRANSIITEFLTLAKNRVIRFEPVSLPQVLEALCPLLSTDALKQEKRIIVDQKEAPQILADSGEIRQLILNLVRNGLEAMNSGGTLTIGIYGENDEVILLIKDEGTGIDPSILEKLGRPFVTTKANGTGLGLAVCYSIASRHKAKLDFDTGTTGTTVYVRFKALRD